MGHRCAGYYVNCTIQFGQDGSVSSVGNVTRGEFKPNADVAGIGTVLALVIPTGFGLFVSLIIGMALILDRVPGVYRFLRRRPVLRNLVPSPNQIPVELPTDSQPLIHHANSSETLASNTGYEQVPLQDHPEHSPGHTHSARGSAATYYDDHPERPEHRAQRTAHARSPRHHWRGSRPKGTIYYRPITQRNVEQAVAKPSATKKRSTIMISLSQLQDFSDRNTLSETRYDMLEAIMLCIPDSQILIALALGLSFASRSKCTTSQYHMNVVVWLSLIACTNFLLAFTLVRNFWRSKPAGIIRICCFTGVLIFLMFVFIWQRRTGWTTESWPPDERKDSLILFNAICFMQEQSLQNFTHLSDNQYSKVGKLVSTSQPFSELDLLSYLIICIIFVITLIIRVYQFFKFRTNGPPRGSHTDDETKGLRSLPAKTWLIMAWWLVSWLCCGIIYIVATRRIFHLRSWIAGSEWMESDEFSSNPENDVRGFGQVTPLVATGAIILAAMDTMKPRYVTCKIVEEEPVQENEEA
ncbi:hypothetical protein LCI18_002165 [Fusarium solani-melongenae]|uniref:Uncharacterized protein n=1 Tax=Fusarium solani subsp. cucurbitae TaxID=2747967 RepID=A0ACD3YQL9_FUSSC|nr:hypothetical protein LCI18_002165 [Fusarium solani-melongenae]